MKLGLALVVVFCLAGLGSAGLLQRIQQIGRRQSKPDGPKTAMPILGNRKANTTTTPAPAEEVPAQVLVKQQEPQKPAIKVEPEDLGTCGGNVLLDLMSTKTQTFSSSFFPLPRKTPYACSWNVKVSKSCKRGHIVLKFNDNSRLSKENRCAKGYVRVAPILSDAKVCGNLTALPPLKWVVDSEDQREEGINVVMKNIGINDGNPEGISFTLSGECLADTTKTNLNPLNAGIVASWLSSASRKPGVTVFSRILPVGKTTTEVTTDIDDILVNEPVSSDEEDTEVSSTTKRTVAKATTTTATKKPAATTKATTVKKSATTTKKPATTTTTKKPANKTEDAEEKPQKTYVSVGYYLLRRFLIPPGTATASAKQ